MRINKDKGIITVKALLVSVLYIGISIAMGLCWETNDDPAISFLLSRAGNDYSPFQWRLLSIVIHFLYMRLPIIDWWAVCNVFSIWLSAFVCTTVIFRRYDKKRSALVLLPVLILLWFTALYRVNFTRTATVISMSGSLLIADAVFESEAKRFNWIRYCSGMFMLLLGASVRKQSAMISLGFLAVIGFLCLVGDHFSVSVKWLKTHIQKIAMLCLAAGIFFGACFIHDQALSPEQKDFVEYNRKRSAIQDYSGRYPEYEEAVEDYEAAGLSEYGYELLFGWASEDTEVFTNETLDKVIRLGVNTPSLSGMKSTLNSHKLITFLAVMLVFMVSLNQKYGYVSALVTIGTAVALCTYLILDGRFPSRVYMSVVWSVVCANIFLSGTQKQWCIYAGDKDNGCLNSKRNWVKRGISIVVMIGYIMNAGIGLWRVYNCVAVDHNPATVAKNESTTIYNRNICDLIQEDQEHIYIYDMYYEIGSINSSFSFWEPRPVEYNDNRFCLGGWNARHPYRLELMEEYGFDNPMRALFERTDVYSTYSPRLLRYLRYTYGSQMSVSEVKELNGIALVQYTFFLDDKHLIPDETHNVMLNEFRYDSKRKTDAWFISASVDETENEDRVFFCNITVNSLRYTYQLNYENGELSGYLYGIGEDFDVQDADIRFFEKIDGSYYVYNFI